MSASAFAAWTPSNDSEKVLKDTISQLQASVGNVVKNLDDPNTPNRFVLQSKGYFDLRSYVLSGRQLAKSDYEFETQIPLSSLRDIPTFDKDIYPRTKSGMVGIGSSCDNYARTELSRLVTAANTAISWSDGTVQMLTGSKNLSIQKQLNILLDPKYDKTVNQDDDYKDAMQVAISRLQMLTDEASSKKKEVDDILEKLIRFKDETVTLQPNIKYITKQFKIGPAENTSTDSAKKKPYLEQINAEYAEKASKLVDMCTSRDKKFTEWQGLTGGAVGSLVLGFFGLFPMIGMSVAAGLTKAAYNELKKQVQDMNEEQRKQAEAISRITSLITHCIDIESKMNAAIHAMQELSLLFQSQGLCYESLRFELEKMRGDVTFAGKNCRLGVDDGLGTVAERLKELKNTALEFTKNVIYEENP